MAGPVPVTGALGKVPATAQEPDCCCCLCSFCWSCCGCGCGCGCARWVSVLPRLSMCSCTCAGGSMNLCHAALWSSTEPLSTSACKHLQRMHSPKTAHNLPCSSILFLPIASCKLQLASRSFYKQYTCRSFKFGTHLLISAARAATRSGSICSCSAWREGVVGCTAPCTTLRAGHCTTLSAAAEGLGLSGAVAGWAGDASAVHDRAASYCLESHAKLSVQYASNDN